MAPEHLSDTLNFECQALSRLAQDGAKVPEALNAAQQASSRPRLPSFFGARPRALLERATAQDKVRGQGA